MPPDEMQLVDAAKDIFHAAVKAVRPESLLQENLLQQVNDAAKNASGMTVLSTGKAGLAILSALEEACPNLQHRGVAIVPHGYVESRPKRYTLPRNSQVYEAGHPVPDQQSVRAGKRLLELASKCDETDVLLVMISGGTSALTTVPRDPFDLTAVRQITNALLTSGADIHQMNTVRRQLTALGGGKLAKAAYPARVIVWVISDVVGDDLHAIGSGPTVPDPSASEDATQIIETYLGDYLWATDLIDTLKSLPRNPQRGDEIFRRVSTQVIGSNQDALKGAARRAKLLGFEAVIHHEELSGEARQVGRALARQLADPHEMPVCHIWGGETTVTVRGSGKGGRNQEVALSAGIEMADSGLTGIVLSAGTDGIDGPTDAAGAWSSAAQIEHARSSGLDPAKFLQENDAYAYFNARNALIKTGPTHTNVMDVVIALSNTDV